MCRYFLLFTILPVVDLAVLIRLGRLVGFLPTVGIILLTALLGSFLVNRQAVSLMKKISDELAQGRVPTRAGLEGALLVIGGVLLITPGFITDLLGLMLLFPPTRLPFLALLERWFERQIRTGRIHIHGAHYQQADVIDGEVIDSRVVDPDEYEDSTPGPIPLPDQFEENGESGEDQPDPAPR